MLTCSLRRSLHCRSRSRSHVHRLPDLRLRALPGAHSRPNHRSLPSHCRHRCCRLVLDYLRRAISQAHFVGFQLVPVGLMLCVLPFMKESPRWLAAKHRDDEALANLAWIRKTSIDEPSTRAEFDEIVLAVHEEESVVGGRSWREAFAPGNRIRFFIAFAVFTFQQWSGQNSVSSQRCWRCECEARGGDWVPFCRLVA